MSCPKCEELQEEIAYLKGERRDADRATELCRLRETTKLSPCACKVLHALYRARGRVVASWLLAEEFSTERAERHLISVYINRIRKAFGFASVITAWGEGYRLSEDALARVSAIISGEPNGAAP